MFIMQHELIIGDKVFPAVDKIQIASSRETISDTIIIQLPKYRKLQPSDIQEGDRIYFRAGYKEYGYYDEFVGIVSEVSPRQPLVIKGQDYFYFLRDVVTKVYKRIYCGSIIKQLCSGTVIDTQQVQNGIRLKYKIYRNKSKRFIFKDLARICGYDCFFEGKKLIFDIPFSRERNVCDFKYGHNVISDNLTFKPVSDYTCVKVISEETDGSGKIFIGKAGQSGKEKFVYIDNLSRKDTIKRAKELLSEYQYQGFRGDFQTFGYPSVKHSSIIWYEDEQYPEKTGNYSVNKVEKNYGTSGYRQRIYLGEKQ